MIFFGNCGSMNPLEDLLAKFTKPITEGGYRAMTKNNSCLPDGGELMTDAQYKGMLVDQRKLLETLRKMAQDAGNIAIVEKIDEELEVIKTKLEF